MMYANSVHLLDYVNILGRGKIKTVQTNISKIYNYCKAEDYHQKYIEKNKA